MAYLVLALALLVPLAFMIAMPDRKKKRLGWHKSNGSGERFAITLKKIVGWREDLIDDVTAMFKKLSGVGAGKTIAAPDMGGGGHDATEGMGIGIDSGGGNVGKGCGIDSRAGNEVTERLKRMIVTARDRIAAAMLPTTDARLAAPS